MDINHSTGENVITSTKAYMWFLSLNIIFCAWLLLRSTYRLDADALPQILQILCGCIAALSATNLIITLNIKKNINDGFYHTVLPFVVLTLGLLWAALFINFTLYYQNPLITLIMIVSVLLPATITFFISGRLLLLFSTPLVLCLLYVETALKEQFSLMQFIGSLIMLSVIYSARYILLEWYQRVQRSEYEKNILIKKLMQQAHYDALTGLFNRLSMARFFEECVSTLSGNKKKLFMIVLDIDYFKQYNDRYGHVAGDKCLIKVSQCIEQSLRKETDSAFRFGGEEFVVMTVCNDISQVKAISHRIQQNIAHAHILHEGSAISSALTVSQGIAQWSEGVTLEGLVEQTDQQLYQAKQNGRNRVCY
ncbi:membrane-associated sensor domain-containing protein [Buttiauxella selenatireducens]|uniref:diguanylate cyclase n=1 Tax=Buttiauxella selenatireducens TaxID=3073902 RepID=A0ABY9S933_9ENTR|nr:membrane-associated sensor domain-containing protein [Buttiauxella sp. R73]WMY74012.1 membrane-associated sensor domain-containing protein [Buttiauxella sp. R73]